MLIERRIQMAALDTPTLDQALVLAQQLAPADQLRLLGLLASRVAQTLGTWPADLPLRREDLYDDDGR